MSMTSNLYAIWKLCLILIDLICLLLFMLFNHSLFFNFYCFCSNGIADGLHRFLPYKLVVVQHQCSGTFSSFQDLIELHFWTARLTNNQITCEISLNLKFFLSHMGKFSASLILKMQHAYG